MLPEFAQDARHYEVGLDLKPLPDDYDEEEPVAPTVKVPKIEYRPCWFFWWEQTSKHLYLCIRVVPPDVRAIDIESGVHRPVSWRFVCPEDASYFWLNDRIAGIEKHERCERLVIDGEVPFDPHNPDSLYYPWNHPNSVVVGGQNAL